MQTEETDMLQIVSQNDPMPDWCEIHHFNIVDIGKTGLRFEPSAANERLVSCAGSVNVIFKGGSQVIGNGQFIDIGKDDGPIMVTPVNASGRVVRLSGNWGTELGGCGIFSALDTDTPSDKGDPVAYEKTTSIDSHYHDCDEFWILLEGKATVVVSNKAAEMKPGDCLCIRMGHHHDMAHAPEKVQAVYFETSLGREKRVGHLWEHTHGPAIPAEGPRT
jgi:mannose-6-phosphate isomerase-like protein (cupin superfamily)